MAILRGQEGPNIPMMAFQQGSNAFTCEGRVRILLKNVKQSVKQLHRMILCVKFGKSTTSSGTPHLGYSTMAVLYTSIVLTFIIF